MDHGPRLSSRERKILAEIEQTLSEGNTFPARPHSAADTWRGADPFRPTAGGICVLAALSLVLLVAAAATSWPLLMWCFALVWASMLAATALHIRGWCGEQSQPDGDRPHNR
ncbi:DUF3040 domain-containing protein [Streptomyces avidinii]|uniref:DUF3040 domain-containing protein n=1 Tax=Streptomyces TaxID=1883 RepID=UPI000F3A851B|nr:DUF3040 domain-containing protein [Streptomyces sp. ADI95-16]AYV26434.1 hypothetical protein EES41_06830 [Streptomyces sp. ADI95-16]